MRPSDSSARQLQQRTILPEICPLTPKRRWPSGRPAQGVEHGAGVGNLGAGHSGPVGVSIGKPRERVIQPATRV